MTRPISDLTKFILSLPRSIPPKEVIARAKAKGMSASKSNISRVRRMKRPGAAKPVLSKPALPAVHAAAASAASKPIGQSKSAFIRSLPATMSAGAVVAKAKAAGIKIGEAYVYNVRGRAAGKGKKKVAAAAKKLVVRPTAPTSAAPTKAEFVREHPTLSPRAIVAKAKAAGIQMGVHYVYNVRAQGKVAGKKTRLPAIARPTKPVVTRPARPAIHSDSHFSTDARMESLLKSVAAELGLKRAMEVLEGERARVRAVLSSVPR